MNMVSKPCDRKKAERWVGVCGGVEDGWVGAGYYIVAMSTTGADTYRSQVLNRRKKRKAIEGREDYGKQKKCVPPSGVLGLQLFNSRSLLPWMRGWMQAFQSFLCKRIQKFKKRICDGEIL